MTIDDRIAEQNLNHNHESLSDQNLQKQFVTDIVKPKATDDICTKFYFINYSYYNMAVMN